MDNKEMSEKILNKKFKKAVFSGYDTTDVDNFFDMVIEYLKNNDKMVELYKKDSSDAIAKVNGLLQQIADLQKDNKRLINEVKEYQDEGYGNMLLKQRNKKK